MKLFSISKGKWLVLSFSIITGIIIFLGGVSLYLLSVGKGAVQSVLRNSEIVHFAKEGVAKLFAASHLREKIKNSTLEIENLDSKLHDIEEEFSNIEVVMSAFKLRGKEKELADKFFESVGKHHISLRRLLSTRKRMLLLSSEYKGEIYPDFFILMHRELMHITYINALRDSVRKKKILVGTTHYEECGLYKWYSQNSIGDKNLFEILNEEIHPLHVKLHEAADEVNRRIQEGNFAETEILMNTAERDIVEFGRLIAGIRQVAFERYQREEEIYSKEHKAAENIFRDGVKTARDLQDLLQGGYLVPSLAMLKTTTTRSGILIAFLCAAGAFLSSLIAISSIRRVREHTRELEEEIFERKHAERRLEKQSALVSTVLESLPHPFYVIDGESYVIRLANKAAYGGQSLPANEKITCYQMTHNRSEPCGGAAHPCGVQTVKETKSPCVNEHIHFDQKGSERIVEVYSYPILDESGHVREVIEYCLDITARKEMEKKLQLQKERELRQAMQFHGDRLAALGEMATAMAHEINQPLNVIAITLQSWQVLQKRGKLDSLKTLGDVDRLMQNVNRIARIIDHVRGLARVDQELKEAGINSIIQDALSLCRMQFKQHGIAVEENLADDLPMIRVVASELEQVFLNLFSNSRFALDEKKKKEPRIEACVRVRSFRDEHGTVNVIVEDNGGGVQPEVEKFIFDPFFTTKPSTKGTGMGLNISSQIMQRFGGGIRLHNNPGRGAAFEIWLPAMEPRC